MLVQTHSEIQFEKFRITPFDFINIFIKVLQDFKKLAIFACR